jgi:hypothetical protein
MIMAEQTSGIQKRVDGTILHFTNDYGTGVVLQQESATELLPQNYTQVGGVYGLEIRPQFLSSIDNVQIVAETIVADEREPRFFRIK